VVSAVKSGAMSPNLKVIMDDFGFYNVKCNI
jgi:hypothetical protein